MLAFYLSLLPTEDEKNTFTALYRLYEHGMYRIAFAILHDRFLAEDAVHDAFLRLVPYIPKINDLRCHKTKALTVIIIRSTAIDLYRTRKRQFQNEEAACCDDEPDPCELPLDRAITADQLQALTDGLINDKKEFLDVLTLRYLYGYDDEEIAHLLGISHAAVRQRMSRAHKTAKALLEREDAPAPTSDYKEGDCVETNA